MHGGLRRPMQSQVLNSREQALLVVVDMPENEVARRAKEASDGSRSMIVVDAEPPPSCLLAMADRTQAALRLAHRLELPRHQLVREQRRPQRIARRAHPPDRDFTQGRKPKTPRPPIRADARVRGNGPRPASLVTT